MASEPLRGSTRKERERNMQNPRTGFRMRELRDKVTKLRQYNRRLENLVVVKDEIDSQGGNGVSIFSDGNGGFFYGPGGRERRANILEKQLIENATKFANDISQLKLRLFEIQMGSKAL